MSRHEVRLSFAERNAKNRVPLGFSHLLPQRDFSGDLAQIDGQIISQFNTLVNAFVSSDHPNLTVGDVRRLSKKELSSPRFRHVGVKSAMFVKALVEKEEEVEEEI